jgi:hypothetical protein
VMYRASLLATPPCRFLPRAESGTKVFGRSECNHLEDLADTRPTMAQVPRRRPTVAAASSPVGIAGSHCYYTTRNNLKHAQSSLTTNSFGTFPFLELLSSCLSTSHKSSSTRSIAFRVQTTYPREQWQHNPGFFCPNCTLKTNAREYVEIFEVEVEGSKVRLLLCLSVLLTALALSSLLRH